MKGSVELNLTKQNVSGLVSVASFPENALREEEYTTINKTERYLSMRSLRG